MSQRYGDGVAPDVAEVDIVGSDESVGVNGVPIELCSCGVSVGRPARKKRWGAEELNACSDTAGEDAHTPG